MSGYLYLIVAFIVAVFLALWFASGLTGGFYP